MGTDARTVIRAGPVWARLDGPADAVAAAVAALTVDSDGARYTPAFRQGRWDGTVKFMRRPENRFLAGFVPRVAGAIVKAGLPEPEVVDDDPGVRPWRPGAAGLVPFAARLDVALRDYQVDAVDYAVVARRCGIECPTGGGKTEIAIELIRRLGMPTLWLTHREVLLAQTAARIRERLPGIKVGTVPGPDATGQVVVGMVQTLAGYAGDKEWFRSFGVLVIDEAHREQERFAAVAEACDAASYRYALSASLSHVTSAAAAMKMEGVTGPIHTVSTIRELVDAEHLADPEVHVLRPPITSYPSYEEVREEAFPGWRSNPMALRSKGAAMFMLAYRRGIMENDVRNAMILALAQRHAAMGGERVLVLLGRVDHARALAQAAINARIPNVYFLDGAAPLDRRRDVIQVFRAHSLGAVLYATPFMREGVDIPEIDVLVMGGGGKADIVTEQSAGRALRRRPDKPRVRIYDFADGGRGRTDKDYLLNQWVARLGTYKQLGFRIPSLPPKA
jgi:superfamily II DNA or RNA helicase